MVTDTKIITKALHWAVDIDPPAIIASVQAERRRSPEATNVQLAKKAFSAARWKASATGVATGLPSNPWVSFPSAVVDVATTLKIEVNAAAKVAVIYDENFFEDDDAKWELLIPIFGLNVVSQFSRELGVLGGMGLTRQAIKKYISGSTLGILKKIMLKYFGIKVTQKGIISKTLPIIGGAIGGYWNYAEVSKIRNRTIAYFETN